MRVVFSQGKHTGTDKKLSLSLENEVILEYLI
jgi:hypothetical protein